MFNHEERIAVLERIVKDLLQHFDALTRHDSA